MPTMVGASCQDGPVTWVRRPQISSSTPRVVRQERWHGLVKIVIPAAPPEGGILAVVPVHTPARD